MIETLKFVRGSALIFTSGEYSDFGLSGVLVTIKDCDLPALAKEYVAQEWAAIKERGGDDWDKPGPDGFAGWLCANGHAMAAEAQCVHLGSYGEFGAEFGVSDDPEAA